MPASPHFRRPTGTSARWIGAVAFGAASVLVLAGCSGSGDSGDSGGEGGAQTLTFGLSADPATPITGMQQGGAVNQLLTMVHRGLMTYDETGAVVPGVAESVDTSDPTSYVFTLRPDLTFSDDSPLTSENVKNSLDYYRDPANGSQLAAGLKDITDITADGDTVTITLAQPNTAFLQYLALPFAAIVPDASLNPDTPNWVGAGPFEMTNLDQGIGLTVEKNDAYYDADEVSLDSIEVKFYPDGEARTNALLSGDVDMIEYVPWENFQRVADAGLTVDAQQGPFQYVQFNVTDGPFADPKVRQAVAYALNRENAVTAAFQSNGAPLDGIVIPEDDPAYDPKAGELWSYDPEKAKELLADAGYPDGFSATLLSTSQYTFLQDNALSVQEDLRAVGIDVTLDAPDWSTRVSKGNAGEYDLAVSGDAGVITDPSYLLNWVVDSRNFNVGWGYSNDTLRGLIEEGLRAADDDAGKKAIYEEIADIWAEDVPFASINTREQAYAYSDKVKGFETLPGFLVFYSSLNLAHASVE
ncbi:ABC transporter substrate-binding protein [Microbacterium sp. GCS4]|uniref:ABC transporter substrate-binding protein n=1 Tax=Microbacterium sp. GCS4 TaxID=1692239 RepID=UPI000682347D|nr:ABC transporter substrate-binding protein [Microbacterium sp. GCS4]